jgi:hypothetical protein
MKQEPLMIANRICVIALMAGSTIIGSSASAQWFDGPQVFDGNWRIAARTTNGHCEYVEFPLVIQGGRIFSTGGAYGGYSAQVGGQVFPDGQVRVRAMAGPRDAMGTGQLARFEGRGTWAGRGPSGVCSGVWNAYRSWF